MLQRATLAEKEVTTLKEQLANNPPGSGDGKEGSNNNMERHSFESEIVAKDKEVSGFWKIIRLARVCGVNQQNNPIFTINTRELRHLSSPPPD